MVKMTYAIAALAVGIGLGYYHAFSDVNNGMCKDPAFATNIATLQAKCPTGLSTFDLISYYDRLGSYSTIPK